MGLAAAAAGVLLVQTVQGGQDDHRFACVAGQQPIHQVVAGAPEGIRLAIAGHTQRRFAVTVIVGAAEHYHRIGLRIHLRHAHAEVPVVGLVGEDLLPGDPGTGNAVVVGLL